MKKYFIFALFFLGLVVFAQNVKAATIVIGWNAEDIKARYSGSVLVENDGFDKHYWYVNPEDKERYLLKDGKSVSQLLKTFGTGIHDKDLEKIASNENSANADYNLSHKMRGQILLQVESDGQAWYINPLDDFRYHIANGKNGFDTLKSLAIEISEEKLKVIPISKNKYFSAVKNNEIDFDMYWSVIETLKDSYYKPEAVNDKNLFYGSLKGLAQSLNDPYTEFFTPTAKNDFDNRLEGSVEGIGAMVDTRNGILEIISPLEGSPAQKAKLLPADQVWFVDGVDIRGYYLDDATALIKGEAGTEVLLQIYRPSTAEIFEIKIIREKISVPNVAGKELDGNIAYIKINMFSLNLKNEFSKVKSEVINNYTKGLIIDLRNNPGGYTNSATALADYWLSEDEVIFKEKYPTSLNVYTATGGQEINLPTIILVNNGTASAAEIFSAALSENSLAKIVGTQTFGKGTGQSLANFPEGSALKYTIFEWLTPESKSIEKNGLTPEFVIDNSNQTDLQLQKALELIKL